VTDANLVLGYLDADAPLAGDVSLDREAAEAAVGRLAEQLDLDPIACAEGIIRVANAEMVRALRVVTVERGVDPRQYALLAFGGAGGLHAAQIAEELGIDSILVPRASGVLAALGLVVSPRRRDVQRSVFLSGDDLTEDAIAETVHELGDQARRALRDDEAELQPTFELRYVGQSFELPVQAGGTPEELRTEFERLHEERYGYKDPDQTLELVTIRVTATSGGADVSLSGEQDEVRRRRREATLAGERIELEVLSGAAEVKGPAVVELPESTVLVPPGWRGDVDGTGTLKLERA
jgi:N-methylhydantoinase A